MKKILIPVILILLCLLWNTLTNTAPEKGFGIPGETFFNTTGTARECSIDSSGSPITKSYVGAGWQVNIFIPFYGCISNDPTPQYIRVGGFKLTIATWNKGWHRVEILHIRIK